MKINVYFRNKKGININIINKYIDEMINLIGKEKCEELFKLDYYIYKCIRDKVKINFKDEAVVMFDKEFVKNRKQEIKNNIKQLNLLKKQPLIKQRTQEWYDIRKERLTASDLEEAIGNNCLKLAKKKAGVLKEDINYSSIPPLKWGTMFEEMAQRCYSQCRNDINVFEFGLVVDNNQEHFGASPDGINELGVMIEIKCPYKRKIEDNKIPYKYYLQIQGQLATCQLTECDYIECDFKTYDSFESYLDNIKTVHNNKKTCHGIIAEYRNELTKEYYYIYSDAYLTADEAHKNILEKVQQYKDDKNIFIRYTYWNLQLMNIQRVSFDKKLWDETVPKIETFWNKVIECKNLPIEEVKQKQKVHFIAEDD